MQNAPSVSYPVGRSHLYAALLVALAIASGVGIAWGVWGSAPTLWANPLRWAVAAIAWLVWCGWACAHWLRSPRGMLSWDARAAAPGVQLRPGAWRWTPLGQSAGPWVSAPQWVYDGQRHVLLRMGRRPGAWLWLTHSALPSRWDDLRRALVATERSR